MPVPSKKAPGRLREGRLALCRKEGLRGKKKGSSMACIAVEKNRVGVQRPEELRETTASRSTTGWTTVWESGVKKGRSSGELLTTATSWQALKGQKSCYPHGEGRLEVDVRTPHRHQKGSSPDQKKHPAKRSRRNLDIVEHRRGRGFSKRLTAVLRKKEEGEGKAQKTPGKQPLLVITRIFLLFFRSKRCFCWGKEGKRRGGFHLFYWS